MLDLDHPQTNWIFEASGLEGAVLTRAKKMTLVPTCERKDLLDEVFIFCDDMKILNKKHFSNSNFINEAVDELYKACTDIANIDASKDMTDGTGNCEVCNTRITNLKGYSDMIYCDTCLTKTDVSRGKLESSEGFGTCWI